MQMPSNCWRSASSNGTWSSSRVAGKRHAPQSAAAHEHLVGAPVDLLGLEQQRKAAEHRRADAGAAENVEDEAALGEGFEDADMGRAETAAAGGDVADRAPGQEAVQALEVEVVLERYVVMHPHVALRRATRRCPRPGRCDARAGTPAGDAPAGGW